MCRCHCQSGDPYTRGRSRLYRYDKLGPRSSSPLPKTHYHRGRCSPPQERSTTASLRRDCHRGHYRSLDGQRPGWKRLALDPLLFGTYPEHRRVPAFVQLVSTGPHCLRWRGRRSSQNWNSDLNPMSGARGTPKRMADSTGHVGSVICPAWQNLPDGSASFSRVNQVCPSTQCQAMDRFHTTSAAHPTFS